MKAKRKEQHDEGYKVLMKTQSNAKDKNFLVKIVDIPLIAC